MGWSLTEKWTPEQERLLLEKMKERKVAYCKENDLPIPSFECEDDYFIPELTVTITRELSKSFLDDKTIRIRKDYEIPLTEFVTDVLPDSCASCPVGFQSIPNHPCGRNVPYKPEDWKSRPRSCRLMTIDAYLKSRGLEGI